MDKVGCRSIIYSSSATVYGDSHPSPLHEGMEAGHALRCPYAKTKHMVEEILKDLRGWRVCCLRYFNPVGCAQPELRDHSKTNVMPILLECVRDPTQVFTMHGIDYDTPDGTCLRDYVHVSDLAEGHIRGMEALAKMDSPRSLIVNLGTGTPVSVQELVGVMQKVSGRQVQVVGGPRRAGDVMASYACVDTARQVLGWTATKTLEDMCRDSWGAYAQYGEEG